MPHRPTQLLPGRVMPVLAHLANCAVGITAFVSPTDTVEARVASLVYLWAGLFTVGGLAGAYGALRRQWITERTALLPEGLAWTVYALSLIARWVTDGGATWLFVSLAFAGLVAWLGVRHQQLTVLAKTSAEWERRR